MKKDSTAESTPSRGDVRFMVLDPGHFHAALVQKTMYDRVSPVVNVYAPGGTELQDYLKHLEGFNSRAESPTHWRPKVYEGSDFLAKMLQEKPGNVMVTAGNNRSKTKYIAAAIDAGINVLSDKPMCFDVTGWQQLKAALQSAVQNHVLAYDIMTERHEVTTVLQKELVNTPEVFGELRTGSPERPSVVKESVHHLFKSVAGKPVRRPAWYFDVSQQGEGIVDVTTHLVDLVMWECFPEQSIDYLRDIRLLSSKHWPTPVTRRQYQQVTGMPDFPDYLKGRLDSEGVLPYFCNGEMTYTLRGSHVGISVIWNFQAPPGTGDTHYSVIRGSRSDVIIRQGKEQNYRPELYIQPVESGDFGRLGESLTEAIDLLQEGYPGVELRPEGQHWHVLIPDDYHLGHEAHFRQVTEKYLQYLEDGKLPDWEVPNMIAKYYTTTAALELAAKS